MSPFSTYLKGEEVSGEAFERVLKALNLVAKI